jgi:hypothetical protein
MSISFITGKPGGGKGLFAMKLILDELKSRNPRPVVTNLAIRPEPWVSGAGIPHLGLIAYLKKTQGVDFNLAGKVHVIDDEQAREFYRWRVVDGKLVQADLSRSSHSDTPDGIVTEHLNKGGVLYVVDEAWKFFGARDWQKTGKVALWYQAQHRKFGDDVMLCAQNTKQVDTAFRQLAQEFIVVQNHSKMRLGIFRQPELFSVSCYDQPPGPAAVSMYRTVFRLDAVGIGGCYDTSAGVGLAGQTVADVGKKHKGLHWSVFIIGFVVGLALLLMIPRLLGKGVGNLFKPAVVPMPDIPAMHPAVTNQPPEVQIMQKEVSAEPPRRHKGSRTSAERVEVDSMPEETQERLTGLVRIGKDVFITTTEGLYRPGDPELEYVGKNSCIIKGRLYRFARKEAIQDRQPKESPTVSQVP